MAKNNKTEVVVIGAGPGGYAAAFHAADLGKQVIMIDPKENPGGVCLFHGCIPTKALLHFASVKEETYLAKNWGLDFKSISVDIEKVRNWKNDVVRQLTSGLGQLCKSRKVNYIRGKAKFKDTYQLEVEEHEGDQITLEFENAIIATGARAASLPGIDFDQKLIINAETALKLEDIPENLLVVGAGYIGLEMSMIYEALGSNVSIIELQSDIVPGMDKDLANVFRKMRKDLMDNTSFESRVTDTKKLKKKLKVTIEDKDGNKKTETFDKMLVSIGAVPNSENVGLEKAGIETNDKNFIKVNEFRQTKVDHIYAIGDVTGQPLLAHKASHEGRVAAEHIAGKKTAYEPKVIPGIVYTEPELAWVGLTEKEAKEQGREIEVTKFPWSASGRTIAMGQSNGLTKLIIDPKTERILGAGFAGKNAGSLVPEATLAIEMGAVAKDLELTIHPHPTLSETIMEAAEMFYGGATHVYKPKRKK
jgi:dihydrolipoamide dehydrogenase